MRGCSPDSFPSYSSHCEKLFTWQFPLIFVSLWEVAHLTVPLIFVSLWEVVHLTVPPHMFSAKVMSGADYITIFQPWHFLSLPTKWILNMSYPLMVLFWTCHTLLSCYFEHVIHCYLVTFPTIKVSYSFHRLQHENNTNYIPSLPHNRLWKWMSNEKSA